MKALQGQAGGGEKRKVSRRKTRRAAAPQTSSPSIRRPTAEREGIEVRAAILDHEDALAVLRDRIFALRCAIRGTGFAN